MENYAGSFTFFIFLVAAILGLALRTISVERSNPRAWPILALAGGLAIVLVSVYFLIVLDIYGDLHRRVYIPSGEFPYGILWNAMNVFHVFLGVVAGAICYHLYQKFFVEGSRSRDAKSQPDDEDSGWMYAVVRSLNSLLLFLIFSAVVLIGFFGPEVRKYVSDFSSIETEYFSLHRDVQQSLPRQFYLVDFGGGRSFGPPSLADAASAERDLQRDFLTTLNFSGGYESSPVRKRVAEMLESPTMGEGVVGPMGAIDTVMDALKKDFSDAEARYGQSNFELFYQPALTSSDDLRGVYEGRVLATYFLFKYFLSPFARCGDRAGKAEKVDLLRTLFLEMVYWFAERTGARSDDNAVAEESSESANGSSALPTQPQAGEPVVPAIALTQLRSLPTYTDEFRKTNAEADCRRFADFLTLPRSRALLAKLWDLAIPGYVHVFVGRSLAALGRKDEAINYVSRVLTETKKVGSESLFAPGSVKSVEGSETQRSDVEARRAGTVMSSIARRWTDIRLRLLLYDLSDENGLEFALHALNENVKSLEKISHEIGLAENLSRWLDSCNVSQSDGKGETTKAEINFAFFFLDQLMSLLEALTVVERYDSGILARSAPVIMSENFRPCFSEVLGESFDLFQAKYMTILASHILLERQYIAEHRLSAVEGLSSEIARGMVLKAASYYSERKETELQLILDGERLPSKSTLSINFEQHKKARALERALLDVGQ